LSKRGSIRPATIARAAISASGASGLVGLEPPAPPPVRGSPLKELLLWEPLGLAACVAALVLPEL